MGTSYGFEASTLRQNNLKRTGEQAHDPPGLQRQYLLHIDYRILPQAISASRKHNVSRSFRETNVGGDHCDDHRSDMALGEHIGLHNHHRSAETRLRTTGVGRLKSSGKLFSSVEERIRNGDRDFHGLLYCGHTDVCLK